jgi:hypothetical protein
MKDGEEGQENGCTSEFDGGRWGQEGGFEGGPDGVKTEGCREHSFGEELLEKSGNWGCLG